MAEPRHDSGQLDPSGWYELLPSDDNSLLQGDFISAAGVPVMPPALDEDERSVSLDAEYRDVIVLSQSCDLDHGKLEFALVCPYAPLSEAQAANATLLGSRSLRERLRQGLIIGLHPLNQCQIPTVETEFLVVNFRQAFTVPMDYLLSRAAEPRPRLRLCSPYREHLAQAYARFIMRVGLPVDLPELP